MCPFTKETCSETGCKLWIAAKSMCAIALQAACMAESYDTMKTRMEAADAAMAASQENE